VGTSVLYCHVTIWVCNNFPAGEESSWELTKNSSKLTEMDCRFPGSEGFGSSGSAPCCVENLVDKIEADDEILYQYLYTTGSAVSSGPIVHRLTSWGLWDGRTVYCDDEMMKLTKKLPAILRTISRTRTKTSVLWSIGVWGIN